MKKILIVFGTRPEVIKLFPLIRELKNVTDLTLLHTGQHKELVSPLFELFDIRPDHDLDIMEEGQDLFSLTSKLLPRLKKYILDISPDYVIVQGDTTSSYLAAISAFYLQIPVLHVEAGLRSHSLKEPFPEEFNRIQITGIASYHFAATQLNKENLLNEGVDEDKILVTGNTVVDAIQFILNATSESDEEWKEWFGSPSDSVTVLLTVHRRENHGKPFSDILKAVNILLEKYPELKFLLPLHPNPNIQETINDFTDLNPRLKVVPPVQYPDFVNILSRSDLILTDSGGIQEEGAALGKKVFVLRHKTERQELIESGLGELVGSDTNQIVKRVSEYLNEGQQLEVLSIYGDGKASVRIREFITDQL